MVVSCGVLLEFLTLQFVEFCLANIEVEECLPVLDNIVNVMPMISKPICARLARLPLLWYKSTRLLIVCTQLTRCLLCIMNH